KIVVEGFPKGVMKQMLSGSGFFNDINKNPAILNYLVSYLASLKGRNVGQAGAPAAVAVLVMPDFDLNDEELQSGVTFLSGQQAQNVPCGKQSLAQTAARHGAA